jgi:hypothetical protein
MTQAAEDYMPFYSLITRFTAKKITKERFILEWGILQRDRGISAARRRVMQLKLQEA